MMTRSWAEISRKDSQVKQAVRIYKRARSALQRLDALDPKFKDITKDDLKMPGDIVEENRFGQRSDNLAWFWRLDIGWEGDQSAHMKECTWIQFHMLLEI